MEKKLAKATIVFSDTEDGRVNIAITFEPPINTSNPDGKVPACQACAVSYMNKIQSLAEGDDPDLEADAFDEDDD